MHQAKRVIGVDIDLDLIQQCGHTVQHAFSLQKPSTDRGEGSSEAPKKKKRKLTSGDGAGSAEQPSSETRMHYFPACFPALYGTITMGGSPNGSVADRDAASRKSPAARKRSKSATESSDPPITSFPRNLVFYAANWAEEEIETDADRYDVILAYDPRDRIFMLIKEADSDHSPYQVVVDEMDPSARSRRRLDQVFPKMLRLPRTGRTTGS